MSIGLASKGLYGNVAISIISAITVELPLVFSIGEPRLVFSINTNPSIVYVINGLGITYTVDGALMYTVGKPDITYNICDCD